jgi:hypothetical protein
MRIEAYRMFEYDAEKSMFRCFYAHDPAVDLMQFMTCINVRSVPRVRMHLLDSGSSLFRTPHKDALILGIKTSLYLLESLPIPLFATGPVEQQMWSFLLGSLESRRRIAQTVREMPDHGVWGLDLALPPVVESVEGAEKKPAGSLTQHQHDVILSNLANLSLGGEAAVKAAKDVKEQRKVTSNKEPKGFFRIDKVVNHREEGGETEYLVRWKGYDQS